MPLYFAVTVRLDPTWLTVENAACFPCDPSPARLSDLKK